MIGILTGQEVDLSRFDEFADNLHVEVVTEMAEAYFGARKNIDDMIEVLDAWAEELNGWKPRLMRAAARLHTLLLDEKAMRDFYIALDILPGCIPFPEIGDPKELFEGLPFAFTMKGKYIRSVRDAYRNFHRLVGEYLNGRYYEEPGEGGRKRLTVHYIRFKAMFEYVNEEISRINSRMSTGDTLRYLKGMDPATLEKEKVLEAGVGDFCTLDKELTYKPLERARYDLLEIQELPSIEMVRGDIKVFCKGLWRERRTELLALLLKII